MYTPVPVCALAQLCVYTWIALDVIQPDWHATWSGQVLSAAWHAKDAARESQLAADDLSSVVVEVIVTAMQERLPQG